MADLSKPLFIQKLNVVIPQRCTQHRSTRTLANALIFKETFDAIVNSNYTEERLIPWEAIPNITRATLYVKLTEALRYFVDEETLKLKDKTIDEKPYTKLRQLYTFDRKLEQNRGIVIRRSVHAIAVANGLQYNRKPQQVQSISVESLKLEGNTAANKDLSTSMLPTKQQSWRNTAQDIFENGEFGTNHVIKLSSELVSDDIQWLDKLFASASELFQCDYVVQDLKLIIRKEKL